MLLCSLGLCIPATRIRANVFAICNDFVMETNRNKKLQMPQYMPMPSCPWMCGVAACVCFLPKGQRLPEKRATHKIESEISFSINIWKSFGVQKRL